MVINTVRIGLMVLAGALLTACGGGGGGSSPTPTAPPVSYSLSFNPTPLSGTTALGFAHVATVTATIDKAITGKVNIAIVDKSGVLQPGVAPVITVNGTLSYTAQLTTANTLSKGAHSGNLEVRICSDDPLVCNQPINGSPWQLPYGFFVQDGLAGTTLPVSNTVPPLATAGYHLSFTPSPINAVLAKGFSHVGVVSGALDKPIPFNVNTAVIDKSNILQAGYPAQVNGSTATGYSIGFSTSNGLGVGTYNGSFELRLCQDDPMVCNQPVNGSPYTVPYQFTVQETLSGTTLPLSTIIPPNTSAMSLASCLTPPQAGTIKYYQNGSLGAFKEEWVGGQSFNGQTGLMGTASYSSSGVLQNTVYQYYDTVNQKLVITGLNFYDTAGTVNQLQLNNYEIPANLAQGAPYTFKYSLLQLPTGQKVSETQRTMTFMGIENVALVGTDPSQPLSFVPACRLNFVDTDLLNPSFPVAGVLFFTPGIGLIKSYLTLSNNGQANGVQTSFTELQSTTAVLPKVTAPQFLTSLSLAECSKLPAGLNQTFTQQTTSGTVRRATFNDTFNGQSVIRQLRTNPTGMTTSEHFFDAAVGHLKRVGFKSYDASGSLVSTTLLDSTNDVTTTAAGQTMTVTSKATTTAVGSTVPSISTQSFEFTNLGNEAVITPSGTYNACKVRIKTTTSEEVDHFVPNKGWVKSTTRPVVNGIAASPITSYELFSEP